MSRVMTCFVPAIPCVAVSGTESSRRAAMRVAAARSGAIESPESADRALVRAARRDVGIDDPGQS
jgi:hypothetical protein